MIPTDNLRNFAKYEVVTTIRQSDGARLIATRKVRDEKLPIYWDVEASYPQQTATMTRIELPSTSQMIKKAQEDGYGDWKPVPEDAEPDSKDYLVN